MIRMPTPFLAFLSSTYICRRRNVFEGDVGQPHNATHMTSTSLFFPPCSQIITVYKWPRLRWSWKVCKIVHALRFDGFSDNWQKMNLCAFFLWRCVIGLSRVRLFTTSRLLRFWEGHFCGTIVSFVFSSISARRFNRRISKTHGWRSNLHFGPHIWNSPHPPSTKTSSTLLLSLPKKKKKKKFKAFVFCEHFILHS